MSKKTQKKVVPPAQPKTQIFEGNTGTLSVKLLSEILLELRSISGRLK